MKIYLQTDMEGISGIRLMEQVSSKEPGYAENCALQMGDMNVAIAAAFDAGATEVIATDSHGGGGQVRVEKMDPRAVYELPNRTTMMPSLDNSFDGLILLGRHAMAGTLNGFLDHTMSSSSIFDISLNNKRIGEIGILAAYAGHFNVPVIAMTGDEAAAVETRKLLGDVECAVVKWGLERNRARCLSIPQAHQAIRAAVTNAINRIREFKPFKPSLPATIRMTLYRSDYADELARYPNIKRIDARTVERSIENMCDINRWY